MIDNGFATVTFPFPLQRCRMTLARGLEREKIPHLARDSHIASHRSAHSHPKGQRKQAWNIVNSSPLSMPQTIFIPDEPAPSTLCMHNPGLRFKPASWISSPFFPFFPNNGREGVRSPGPQQGGGLHDFQSPSLSLSLSPLSPLSSPAPPLAIPSGRNGRAIFPQQKGAPVQETNDTKGSREFETRRRRLFFSNNVKHRKGELEYALMSRTEVKGKTMMMGGFLLGLASRRLARLTAVRYRAWHEPRKTNVQLTLVLAPSEVVISACMIAGKTPPALASYLACM
ncbi:predicted protein [Plenodomus lingam JN3]|uniref:Predicted protein n=1 Tax=Leptosphaeria maculans (strain JN3 / isolate v23.1.3 / race Av1-4-5-6-7-8) TaxID=985895 RepID=E4ZMY3_LEPMJ|nr:predicted protein [Plenodomus lingam JN3]CBX92586.1 predicted protein [Plenodomus lingam JN3]